MAEVLLVRLEHPESSRCQWRVVGAEADDAGRPGSLEGAAEAADGRRVVLLLPGHEILLTEAHVPARGRNKALAAIPWALEDRLIADVDALHFAVGRPDGDGTWPVAVIARATFDAYLETARAAGLDPRHVFPEPLALPPPDDGAWRALEDSTGAVVRTAAAGGFACEPELLHGVAAALPPPGHIERLRVRAAPALAWPGSLRAAVDAGGEPRPLEVGIGAFTAADGGIDLLQGPYSRRERAGRVLRQWRPAAALAAALLIVVVAQAGVHYAALGAREAELRARIESIFRETFPEVQRVVNPRAQMTTRLESLRGGGSRSGFAQLLARSGEVVAGAEGVTLRELGWRGGQLELVLEAEDLQALDGLRRALAETGLRAELDQAERSGEQVNGVVRVAEAGE
jgi:general secretion pathway protein L